MSLAFLISVETVSFEESNEKYHVFDPIDRVISRKCIENGWNKLKDGKNISTPKDIGFPCSIIIRTLPNSEEKLNMNWSGRKNIPYFTHDAIRFLLELGFKHILTDLPSVDREDDGGQILNHRIFFDVPVREEMIKFHEDDTELDHIPKESFEKTITEFCYISNDIEDNMYLLNLQLAPLLLDATSSRPILYKLQSQS